MIPTIKIQVEVGGEIKPCSQDIMIKMKNKELSILAHAYNRMLLFNSRNDLTQGSEINCKIMAKWGLAARVGCDDQKSKIGLILTLPARTLSRWRNQHSLARET